MKILIVGGSGMLGHQLWQHFRMAHETWVTLRRTAGEFTTYGLFQDGRVYEGVDAMNFPSLKEVVRTLRPDAVLNCVGIIKQLRESKSPIPSLTINSLLPHLLADACAEVGSRLVLFSTDCVFSGKRGSYTEADVSDAEDLYGRSKYLGEVTDQPHVITLRSSIIGRELASAHSLVDWFLSQRGQTVQGYRHAIYTGLTTIEMARVVERVLTVNVGLSGLWQVASEPINKYEMLLLMREKFQLPVEIQPYDSFYCSRSLVGSRFAAKTGYVAPSWPAMIVELAQHSL